MTMTVALMIASKPRAMCSMTVRRPDTLALMHAAFHYFVHSENECGSQVKTVNIAEKGAVYLSKIL